MVFQWFSGCLSGKLFEVARQHCPLEWEVSLGFTLE